MEYLAIRETEVLGILLLRIRHLRVGVVADVTTILARLKISGSQDHYKISSSPKLSQTLTSMVPKTAASLPSSFRMGMRGAKAEREAALAALAFQIIYSNYQLFFAIK